MTKATSLTDIKNFVINADAIDHSGKNFDMEPVDFIGRNNLENADFVAIMHPNGVEVCKNTYTNSLKPMSTDEFESFVSTELKTPTIKMSMDEHSHIIVEVDASIEKDTQTLLTQGLKLLGKNILHGSTYIGLVHNDGVNSLKNQKDGNLKTMTHSEFSKFKDKWLNKPAES